MFEPVPKPTIFLYFFSTQVGLNERLMGVCRALITYHLRPEAGDLLIPNLLGQVNTQVGPE